MANRQSEVQHLWEAIEKLADVIHDRVKWQALAQAIARCERDLQRAFRQQGEAFRKWFAKFKDTFPQTISEARSLRESISEEELGPIFDSIEMETIRGFVAPLEALTRESLALGAHHLIANLGLGISFDLRHPLAERYIAERGLEASRLIQGATRQYIITILQQAVEEGWSYNRTAKAITDRYAEFAVGQPQKHIRSRAHLIAVYEAGEAYEEGGMIVAQDLAGAGLEMEKRWSTVGAANVCEICRGNQAAGEDGWIPLAQAFPSGHERAQAHPACRCTVMYRRKPSP